MTMTFKVGDKVVRINHGYGKVKVGQIVEVAGVWDDPGCISIKGDSTYTYDIDQFVLAKPVPPTNDVVVKKPAGTFDPTGVDQHAPGAKLDGGKLRPALVLGGFASAVDAMVKVGSDGARKYTDNGWKTVPNGKARYEDALLRHLLAHLRGELIDEESGSPHISHCMWNAAAIYELSKGTPNVQ
jgi:hypothetical protein